MSRLRARMVATLAFAIGFRYACFAFMVFWTLWAEARPAPHLSDLIIDAVPYVPWISRWNYALWLLAYVPPALVLMYLAPKRCARFLVTGGVLSVLRGLCIPLTGLGPVRGPDVNAGLTSGERWNAFWHTLDPYTVLISDTPNLALTKDLFFSGHTATTLLLLLYVWPIRWLRYLVMLLHLLVVASLFLGHIHYTIDVVGAYAITFCLYVFREGGLAGALSPSQLGPSWRELRDA